MTALERDLAASLGDRHVLTDPEVRAGYETDWTGRFGARAAAVARPGSADEVAEVLRICRAHGAAVVPQGGNTGLVGASVPRAGEVVLSLGRLSSLGEVDPATLQVEAGAGATLAALQAHARAAGLDAALDFGARDSATVGGVVACDAGGARALRFGTARARVGGMEAVLAGGARVDRRAGLLKDNAGYDLPALLVGSEGTLGVITSVLWRLVPRQEKRIAALLPLDSVEQVVDALGGLRRTLPSLEAADFFLPEGLALVREHGEVETGAVPDAAAYVLLECAGREDPAEELAAALDAAGLGDDALVADDTASRERLWRVREGHSEAIGAAGVPHKLDVGVPLRRLAEFVARAPALVAEASPGARTVLFGHLGDGNVHVNVLGPEPEDERADEAVLRLAAELGGTLSAEHGVGVAKARFLGLVRPAAEIAAMRGIKRALDPDGLLNPGAVLPDPV